MKPIHAGFIFAIAAIEGLVPGRKIEVSGRVKGELRRNLMEFARQQLLSLSSPAYRATPADNGNFILMHSVGFLPRDSEVDVPLN